MSDRKFTLRDWRHGRCECAHCGEVFVREDMRATTWELVNNVTLWFCSEECRRRHEREARGEQLDPYPGQVLADGFALLHASEYPD